MDFWDRSRRISLAVVLLGLFYLSAYIAVVGVKVYPGSSCSAFHSATIEVPIVKYRLGGRKSEIIFAPIHSIDRRVRPLKWKAKVIEHR